MTSNDWCKVMSVACQNLKWKFHFNISLLNVPFSYIIVAELDVRMTNMINFLDLHAPMGRRTTPILSKPRLLLEFRAC